MSEVDMIKRELVVESPIERVWEAITTPSELRLWFGDVAELDLRPGGLGRVGWTEFGSVTELVVEAVEPPTHFAYSWSAVENSQYDPEVATRVDFHLESLNGSTRIILIESGFAALPRSIADSTFTENSSGWANELEDLANYLKATGV